ncbi:MAG: hypothetical protein F6J93_30115 [Oscillatoria sp. SIO1A7]|nr:hypothetical protein [Oscillatoria sp. SIO1A7]
MPNAQFPMPNSQFPIPDRKSPFALTLFLYPLSDAIIKKPVRLTSLQLKAVQCHAIHLPKRALHLCAAAKKCCVRVRN